MTDNLALAVLFQNILHFLHTHTLQQTANALPTAVDELRTDAVSSVSGCVGES